MKTANPSMRFDDYGHIEIVEGTISHTFPLHIHNSTCYGIITDGTAELYCGDKKLLKSGDTFYIPRRVPHALVAVDNAPYSYRTICIKHNDPIFCDDEFMSNAYNYMLKQTGTPLRIEKMAKHMGYSKYYMVRRFKDMCGISPYQFYLSLQIAKIKQGLHISESLLDLTYHYGFSSQSHLCNIFKKHMGISPMQYRESYLTYANAGENVARI